MNSTKIYLLKRYCLIFLLFVVFFTLCFLFPGGIFKMWGIISITIALLLGNLLFRNEVLYDVIKESGIAYLYYYDGLIRKKSIRIPTRFLTETVIDKGVFKNSYCSAKFNTGKTTVVFEIYDNSIKSKVSSLISVAATTL